MIVVPPWQAWALRGARAWSIPSALPDAWWLDPVGAPLTLTRVAQPVVGNWTNGTGWAGAGATGPYTHTAGAAGDLTQAVGVVGNRVRVTYTIAGRTAGTLTLKAGTTAGTARSTNATFVEELTVAGSTTVTFAADADFDGVLTITSVENISLAAAAPRQGVGDLANDTAARQPWVDSTTGGIRFDGTADYLASSLAASAHPYHKAAGFTWSAIVFLDASAAGNDVIFATQQGIPNQHGVIVYVNNTTGNGIVWVGNASGTFVIYHTFGAVSKNAWHVISGTYSEAGGSRVLVDSAAASTSASVGAASAADAPATLAIGVEAVSFTVPWQGVIGSTVLRVGAVSDAELDALHANQTARLP